MAELFRLGCVQYIFDKAIFYYYHQDHLSGIFQAHVDDFIHAVKKVFPIKIVKQTEAIFKTEQSFEYIGLNIVQNSTEICQSEYIYRRCRGDPSL